MAKDKKFRLPKGTFVFSLDTELAWGTRGNPKYLRDYQNTRHVIKEILRLLNKYNISATWAVVGHLFLDKCEVVDGIKHPEIKRQNMSGSEDWFSIDPSSNMNKDPIWYGRDIVDWIRESKVTQEIGSHTFSHIIFGHKECTREFFSSDLKEAKKVSGNVKSLVFPQNKIGYLDIVKEAGFTNFRGEDENWYRKLPRLLKKIAHVLDNYLVPISPAVLPSKENGIWNIPGSYFFVHSHGWAKFLPASFRVRKIKNGLRRAIKNKGIFHLWTHPFNIASNPNDLLLALEEVFIEVSRLRDEGLLDTMTMAEVAENLDNLGRSVIVLDGGLKSALSAVRSLGSKGVRVSVGGVNASEMAKHSRYVNRVFNYSSPLNSQHGFIDSVINEAKRLGDRPIIFSFSDSTSSTLFRFRNEISKYAHFVIPSEESWQMVYDKNKTGILAKELNIPIPEEIDINSLNINFPIVLKPKTSTMFSGGKGVSETAVIVKDKNRLEKELKRFKERFKEDPILQEYIIGDEFGVEALANDGEILAISAHKRIRSLKPMGGASVLKETVRIKEMEDYATKLISHLKWKGPIMVEFKLDSKSGLYKLIEINGRFWGSLPLAINSGVDFPYLYYLLAQDIRFNKIDEYKIGVVSRHFLGDLFNLFSILFRFNRGSSIRYPARFKALKDFIMSSFSDSFSDTWSKDDIKPFFWEYIDRLIRIIKWR